MSKTIVSVLVTLLCILGNSSVFSDTNSDVAKEQRWADQVVDTLFYGDPVWLEAEGHEFLGLEMPAEDGSLNKGAIVVHGIGVHPNWEQIIQPVRVGLAESGWHTLSIQMPILANEAESSEYTPLFDEVPDRFDSAIDHLKQLGTTKLVIVAHSMGSSMTAYYLAGDADPSIKAAVLVGMSADKESAAADNISHLQQIQIPLLDLYGSDDLESVTTSAESRKSAAGTGGNVQYTQTMVPGANHFFDDQESELLEIIIEWLRGV